MTYVFVAALALALGLWLGSKLAWLRAWLDWVRS